MGQIYKNEAFGRGQIEAFEAARDGRVDTWDHQWAFAIKKNNGLCVVPRCNLVSNIGHGNRTHSRGYFERFNPHNNRPVFEMEFPLIHPAFVKVNTILDEHHEEVS